MTSPQIDPPRFIVSRVVKAGANVPVMSPIWRSLRLCYSRQPVAEPTREETSGTTTSGVENVPASESQVAPAEGSHGPELAKTATNEGSAAQPGSLTQQAANPEGATPASGSPGGSGVLIELPAYEGPLDLLLHLIRKHELDILDIPISFVTERYLAYLSMMHDLQIDVASEYLVMAATLAYIKSKMLLPPDPNEQDEDDSDGEMADPREELVKRLLEYQKYKEIARHLGDQDTLDRDVFERGEPAPQAEGEAKLAQGNVFRLFDAFERVLKHAEQTASHAVLFERVSIAERIIELTELLQENDKLRFDDLFMSPTGTTSVLPPRIELVTTFLAILEMGKMRMIRIVQEISFGELWVQFAPHRIEGDDVAPPAEGNPDDDTPAQEVDDTPAENAGHDPDADPQEEQGQSDAP